MQNKKLFLAFITPTIVVLIFGTLLAFTYGENHIKEKFEVHKNSMTLDSPTSKVVENNYAELSKKGLDLLELDLMTPVREKLGSDIDLEQFGRCPSGLGYYLTTTPDTNGEGNFEGVLNFYDGCTPQVICQFQIDANENIVLVRESLEAEFVSVTDFLESDSFVLAKAD